MTTTHALALAVSEGTAQINKFYFTATAGQTVFSGADDNAATLAIVTAGTIVALNGRVLELTSDYSISTTTVTLVNGAKVGDLLTVYVFTSTLISALAALYQPHGQCQLTKVSANLVLKPKNGNRLIVNGAVCTVPDAGVSLSAAGLTATTLYYIYAIASGGVVTSLEASVTTHATSTTAGNNGVEIKSGDDSRTLVGMARVVSGPAWSDTEQQRFVSTYFERRLQDVNNFFTVDKSVAADAGLHEVDAGATRAEFLIWGDEPSAYGGVTATFKNSLSTAQANSIQIQLDASTVLLSQGAISTSTSGYSLGGTYSFVASEGYHHLDLFASAQGGGTILFESSNTALNGRTLWNATFRG